MDTPEYAFFPTEEFTGRVARLRERMLDAGIDALVLTSKENVIYLGGIRTIGWGSKHRVLGIVVPAREDLPVLSVIPENLIEVSTASSWIPASDLRPWGGWKVAGLPGSAVDALAQACHELGVAGKTIGMERGYGHRLGMSQEDLDEFLGRIPDARIVNAGPVLWDVRKIKSEAEIDALRRACQATDHAFEVAFGALKAGMTETELGAIIMADLATTTHEPPGFVMIRSGQQKYGMVNCEPFERVIQPGDIVVVDIGAQVKHYWSDFMRMAVIGEPSAEQARIFAAERKAQQAGVDLLAPGVELESVYNICYQTLIDAGMGEHIPGMERIGHGIGLDFHEPPSIARGVEGVAEPGMILSVEPIFWDQPDHIHGNFALEDNILITETGTEVLSTFPKDLYIVP